MATLIFQGAMALRSKAGSPVGSGLQTVDGIGGDENGNAQLNADSYCGTWQSGTTYRLNNIVSETVNGIPGLFVCLVASSSAEPSGSSDWRRIAGSASAIDGVSAGSDGIILYNRTQDVTAETVTPSFNGELSQTLNITSSTEVNVSGLANTLFNTNPAAALHLVISATDALSVTFTGSDNYWLPDGTYSTEPPTFDLDGTVSLTLLEVSLVTNSTAPGVLIRQAYPIIASGGEGGGITSVDGHYPDASGAVETGAYSPDNPPPLTLPVFGMPGASGFFICSDTAALTPSDTTSGSKLRYAGINDGETPLVPYANNTPPGTWQMRGYVSSSVDSTREATMFIRIDGTNLVSAKQLLQAVSINERVRDCRYSSADESTIDCEVLVNGTWYPFTAAADDLTHYGPLIYESAVSGNYGEVAAYSEG
jgi:hypothetical protein